MKSIEALAQQNDMLESIRIMQMDFLNQGISSGWCDRILEKLLKLSQSEFGFICELLHKEDSTPFIRSHGIATLTCNESTRQFIEGHHQTALDFFNFNSLWGQAVTSGEVFIANEPDHNPHRGGYPKEQGHPPLSSFIGLPIKGSDGHVLGVMGLANRSGGYSADDGDFLAPFTSTYGLLIENTRETARRQKLEHELLEANSKFQHLLENVSAEYCLYTHDAQGELTYVSPSIEKMLGWTPEELKVNHTTLLTTHPLNQKAVAHTEAALGGVRQPPYTMQLRHKDGSQRWVEVSEGPVFDSAGQVSGIEGIVHNVTERRKNEKRNWHLANFDRLTDLANRNLFFDRLSKEISNSKRSNLFTAVFMLDLDDFKSVNDRYGHEAGDRLLIEVSRRWQRCLRDTDTLARIGGDEFALIIGALADIDMTTSIAEKLISVMSSSIKLTSSHVCTIGVSIGVAIYPNNALEMDSLLSAADTAMYASKENGKNMFRHSTTTPSIHAGEKAWMNFEEHHLTGVTEIDEQHAKLVRLVNQLNTEVTQRNSEAGVRVKLDALIEYTILHFKTEKKLMQACAFPEMNKHIREHQSLISQIEQLSKQFTEKNQLLILQSIKDWLLHHIEYSDKSLGNFLRSQQQEK
ncbi:MAG: hypothetical protein AUJ56_02950 [Zetaproteobacteria bacterium CG1_02_49_23]|nr:MAG: hypothetical protein AUJ56_02950 [Zetaproteobacteria bacterium CG1_02_49_23]